METHPADLHERYNRMLGIFIGGGLGACARYLLSHPVSQKPADSRMHSAKLLSISSDLPIVIEIVDSKETIDLLMPDLDTHLEEGIVTMEAVPVHKYRHK
ncbi:MAG: DUF190 domain-containing protein [Spirochaetota bacterium]